MHNGTQYDVWWVTSVNGQQWAVTLKTVNGNALDGTGNISIDEWITKIFTLASTSDLTTAQEAYDWYANWGNPILKVSGSSSLYTLWIVDATEMKFFMASFNWATSSGPWVTIGWYIFTLSSWTVTAVSAYDWNFIRISDTVPTWYNNSTITFVI